MTKKDELLITIEKNMADIVVISESNMDMSDAEVIEERKTKFPHFSFIDKIINPHRKARLTIMVHEDIPFTRAEK